MIIQCVAAYKSFDEFEKAMLDLGQAMTGVDSIDIFEKPLDANLMPVNGWRCGLSFEDYGLDISCLGKKMQISCDDEQLCVRALITIKGLGNEKNTMLPTISPEIYGIREHRWAVVAS